MVSNDEIRSMLPKVCVGQDYDQKYTLCDIKKKLYVRDEDFDKALYTENEKDYPVEVHTDPVSELSYAVALVDAVAEPTVRNVMSHSSGIIYNFIIGFMVPGQKGWGMQTHYNKLTNEKSV